MSRARNKEKGKEAVKNNGKKLCLISVFLKRIFEFMKNTPQPSSN